MRIALVVGVGSSAMLYYDRPMPSSPDLVRKQVMRGTAASGARS